jgi:hypothetical protein
MPEKKLFRLFKDLKDINRFLFDEFGFEKRKNADRTRISDDYPFKLKLVGILEDFSDLAEVYEFTYRKKDWYVFSNGCQYCQKEGMSLHDLQTEKIGAFWLSNTGALHHGTSYFGEEGIPSALERKRRSQLIVDDFIAKNSSGEVEQSFFLKRLQKSIAMVRVNDEFWLLSDFFEPFAIKFPSIQYGLGILLERKVLAPFDASFE